MPPPPSRAYAFAAYATLLLAVLAVALERHHAASEWRAAAEGLTRQLHEMQPVPLQQPRRLGLLSPRRSPTAIIGTWENWLEHMREMGEGTAKSKKTTAATELEHHGASYLRMLMGALSGAALSCGLTDSLEALSSCLDPYRTGSVSIRSPKLRYSVTMAGHARMESLMQLIKQVATHGPSGSYVEAGVWRGGMSILATAALNVFGQGHRPVYVCDSFEGLPRPREGSARATEAFYHDVGVFKMVLSVGEERVLGHFDLFGVPRTSVKTYKGYFVDSLPKLRKDLLDRGEKLAILRMDGDMYDSTADILYNLYDLVQVGGFVIIDDYLWGSGADGRGSSSESVSLYGAKDALLDFRSVHGIEDGTHPIQDIDNMGAFFQKTREVPLQRERYLKTLSNQATMRSALLPSPPRTRMQLRALEAAWRANESVSAREHREGLGLMRGLKHRKRGGD